MGTLITLTLLAVLAWFWQDSLRTRERAIRAAVQACKEMGAQFLDQTVVLHSLKPVRNRRGSLSLQRIYRFEFSLAGYERLQGRTFMLGQVLEQVQLDRAEGTVIDMNAGSRS